MFTRRRRTGWDTLPDCRAKVVAVAAFIVVSSAWNAMRADIFRWDNGQMIPGTQFYTPGPGLYLQDWNENSRNLRYANFGGGIDLSDSAFSRSWLEHARFTGANLRGVYFFEAALANADFTDALVNHRTYLTNTTAKGFTAAQLYSTKSYKNLDLTGIWLSENNLSGWNFAGQNLSESNLRDSQLTDADFTGAIISRADFIDAASRGFTMSQLESTKSYQDRDLRGLWLSGNMAGWNFSNQDLSDGLIAGGLRGASFAGAIVTGTSLLDITKEQLYETASYQAKDLRRIGLNYNNLANWNFTGQDLSGASFQVATLTGTKFDDAVVENTMFAYSIGFTKEQLYATKSYQDSKLPGVQFYTLNLSGWNFENQDLTGASFNSSPLTNANFNGARLVNADLQNTVARASFVGADLTDAYLASANLAGADLTGAIVKGADMSATTSLGFTAQQLYSTRSYSERDLQRIQLSSNDLSNWNLSGQNLRGARLWADLTNVQFDDAFIEGAEFFSIGKSQVYSTASYQSKSLANVVMTLDDFNDWDLRDQYLAHARVFFNCQGGNDFRGADLRGAYFDGDYEGECSSPNVLGNTISSDGLIDNLVLSGSSLFYVRDHDADPSDLSPPIPIHVGGTMSVSDQATLRFVFEADSWDSTISFDPGIAVNLGGEIQLDFAPEVNVPSQYGRTFHLFNWSGVTPAGTFTVSSPLNWDLSRLYTAGEITLVASGDTNGDGVVDLVDLNNVRNHFGAAGDGILGDTNGDDLVDLEDLNAVRNSFGAGNPVPEPPSLVLLAAGAAGLAALRRKQQVVRGE